MVFYTIEKQPRQVDKDVESPKSLSRPHSSLLQDPDILPLPVPPGAQQGPLAWVPMKSCRCFWHVPLLIFTCPCLTTLRPEMNLFP